MKSLRGILNTTVIVSALGYFVDIYDLLLFSIVRVASLKDLGVPEEQLLNQGVHLLNMQMFGMLIGGILWGVLGDKKGRLSVLFGSIFLYSLANIANAFVHSVESYAALRLIAGIGLAGELGAAITLVSEVLPQKTRGYGTSLVAGIGILGAVAAAIIGDVFHWRTAYLIGGGLGLVLLIMRISMFESGMYKSLKESKVKKGDLFLLLKTGSRISRYLSCIFVGIPIWFVIGILITLSPELSKAIGVTEPVVAGKSVLFAYIGLSFGDIASGFLSQLLKSRKKILFSFILFTFALILVYLFSSGFSAEQFYFLCGLLGFGTGYWAVMITVASEQFGTNLRATVTTTVPNFIRGAVVPITLSFQALKSTFSLPIAALIVGSVCVFLALVSIFYLEESYHRNLDFLERD